MKPAGGNWCWISASRPDLRYGMAHAWRLFVVFSTIIIYIYIWAYLHRLLNSKSNKTQQLLHGASTTYNEGSFFSQRPRGIRFHVMPDEEVELDAFNRGRRNTTVASSSVVSEEYQLPKSQGRKENGVKELRLELGGGSEARQSRTRGGSIRHRPTTSKTGSELAFLDAEALQANQSRTGRESQIEVLQTNASEFPMRPGAQEIELEIKRMMLLNAYPIMYVLLWAPGLINRLMEASGNPNSKITIAALQASTQFVGLANSLTYGFNHHLRDRLNDLYVRPAIIRIRKRLGLC